MLLCSITGIKMPGNQVYVSGEIGPSFLVLLSSNKPLDEGDPR